VVKSAETFDSRFQFSLRQLFVWVTAVSAVCGVAWAWTNHLRNIEAKEGLIPVGTANLTVFLAMAFLTSLIGLLLGPPLCWLLAVWSSSQRKSGNAARPKS